QDDFGLEAVPHDCCSDCVDVGGIHARSTEPQLDCGLDVTHGLDKQPLSFVQFDPAYDDDLVTIAIVMKTFRRQDRRVERGSGNGVVVKKAVCNHLRILENPARITNDSGVAIDYT